MRSVLLIDRFLCFSLVWLTMLWSWAVAQPVITSFESDAALKTDGSLHVTETITATMPGGVFY